MIFGLSPVLFSVGIYLNTFFYIPLSLTILNQIIFFIKYMIDFRVTHHLQFFLNFEHYNGENNINELQKCEFDNKNQTRSFLDKRHLDIS